MSHSRKPWSGPYGIPPDTPGLIPPGTLPPALTSFLLAERYRHDPAAVAAIIALGIPASAAVTRLGLVRILRTS